MPVVLDKSQKPVFEKIGGDWRVGVGLISAFVAREVFVSVLAVTLKKHRRGAKQRGFFGAEHEAGPKSRGGGAFVFCGQCAGFVGVFYDLSSMSFHNRGGV